MNKAVLDTDTLSALMRQRTSVVDQARAYLSYQSKLTISLITRYEILRGLYAKNAMRQIESFEVLCDSMEVLPVSQAVVDRAATIYGALRNNGITIGDADILIGAACLEFGYEIVANNTAHFSHLPNLTLQNWI